MAAAHSSCDRPGLSVAATTADPRLNAVATVSAAVYDPRASKSTPANGPAGRQPTRRVRNPVRKSRRPTRRRTSTGTALASTPYANDAAASAVCAATTLFRGGGPRQRRRRERRRAASTVAPAAPMRGRSHAHPPSTRPRVENAETMDTPAVAMLMEAPCVRNSAAACDTTMSPAWTPRQSAAHTVMSAGRSCRLRSVSSGVSASDASRRPFARGSSRPPRLSITHRGAEEARRSAPVHIAWPGPPTSSNPSNDGGERKRANRASARHESGAETLPERRDGGDLHGKAVAHAGSDAEEEGVSEKERDDADVGERLRREEETRAPASRRAPAPMAPAGRAGVQAGTDLGDRDGETHGGEGEDAGEEAAADAEGLFQGDEVTGPAVQGAEEDVQEDGAEEGEGLASVRETHEAEETGTVLVGRGGGDDDGGAAGRGWGNDRRGRGEGKGSARAVDGENRPQRSLGFIRNRGIRSGGGVAREAHLARGGRASRHREETAMRWRAGSTARRATGSVRGDARSLGARRGRRAFFARSATNARGPSSLARRLRGGRSPFAGATPARASTCTSSRASPRARNVRRASTRDPRRAHATGDNLRPEATHRLFARHARQNLISNSAVAAARLTPRARRLARAGRDGGRDAPRPPLAADASRVDTTPVPAQEVRVTVSPVARTVPSGPHKRFVDVRLDGASVATVRSLAFRNHYAAFLTVKVRVSTSPGPDPAHPAAAGPVRAHRWIDLVVDRRLMADPHYEDDARRVHVVQLPDAVTLDRDACLRAYFHNPSPRWVGVDVQLRNLTAFARGDAASVRAAAAGNCARRATNRHYERESPRRGTHRMDEAGGEETGDDRGRRRLAGTRDAAGRFWDGDDFWDGDGTGGRVAVGPRDGRVGARAACDDLAESFRAAAAAREARAASRGAEESRGDARVPAQTATTEIAYLA